MKKLQKQKRYPVVYATFYPDGHIVPRYIKYRGVVFKTREIRHVWKERHGENITIYFSLTDGLNGLILSYTLPHNIWKVEETFEDIQ